MRNKIILLSILLALIIGFCACMSKEEMKKKQAEEEAADRKRNQADADAAHLLPRINYFRDPRTGLCFAVAYSSSVNGYVISSIAHVPYDSVKNFLSTDTGLYKDKDTTTYK